MTRQTDPSSIAHNHLDLIQIQAHVLYVHDEDNRLLRINEFDADQPAARFFLGRTTAGNIWRVRHDLPPDLAAELGRLAAAEPVVNDLRTPPQSLARYQQLLKEHAPISEAYSGPAYYLPELTPSPNTVTITPENKSLLEANFPYTLSTLDVRSPVVTIVDEGAVVAACYIARSTAQAAEAGVYTEDAYRGRGYAAEMVRGWASAVQTSERIALYSTSWDNRASQAVAQKLGAVLYSEDFSMT